MECQQIMWLTVGGFAATALFPLLYNIRQCFQAILNDARIISRDPALQSNFEILYAYPGFWALFWYRLSHALLHQKIPVVSEIVPRLAMSVVRYATSIDIHPAAQISGEGILIDHGTGLVVGATAVIGGGVTLYHGVTLGNSGRKVPAGAKRHPTIGDRVVIGAGAKILGDIIIGDDVLVGANSVVTKPVPRNHTAVGVPAKVLCHGTTTGKGIAGAAICELHKPLQRVEKAVEETTRRSTAPTAAVVTNTSKTDTTTTNNNSTTSATQTITTATTAIAAANATAPASAPAPASTAATACATAPGSASALATVAGVASSAVSCTGSGLPAATVSGTVTGPVASPVVWAAASPPRGQESTAPAPRGVVFAEELRSGSIPPGFALAKASARGVAAAPAPGAAAVAAAAAATAAAAQPTEVKPLSTTTTDVNPFSTTATSVKPFSSHTSNVKPFLTTTTTADVKPFLTAVKPFSTMNVKPSLPIFLAPGGGRGVLNDKGEGGGERWLGGNDSGRSDSIRDLMCSLRLLREE